jgi:predicted RNA-binding Zn ribbon-like protein
MRNNNHVKDQATHLATFDLLGGRLCLDFANTVDPRVGSHPHELLKNYPDLVQWGQQVDVLMEDEAKDLLRGAARRPEEAVMTLERAIALREVIYRIFSAIARGTNPQSKDLEALLSAYAEVMMHAQLTSTPSGFTWGWIRREDGFDRMLWPVVHSAIELLTSQEVKRVKECPGLGDCGWLFLDTSKNSSRQWCSMDECGSRAKMRRLYARKRVGRSQSAD